ncbi:CBS domain-containing protein [Thermodesulfitimonas autotrophica]|uniref:CBS domain-containing protein n=1 Tax=Thermodesulfitimonas autotrophica TaxID=1894989 RepID=UPI002FE26581
MPAEKKVRDVMIPVDKCPTVSEEATVKEAVTVLARSLRKVNAGEYVGHRAVLVLDREQRPVGLLSYRSLIKAIEPRLVDPEKIPGQTLPWQEGAADISWEGFFTQRVREEARKKIKEVIRPRKLITIEADAPLIKAVHLMVRHDVGSLPVVEKEAVVGMVRISELFVEIANTLSAFREG